MKKQVVDSLVFSFPKDFQVVKYDELESYKRLGSSMQFKCECEKCPSRTCSSSGKGCDSQDKCHRRRQNEGLKGVDLVATDTSALYLIEAKDYRKNEKPPTSHIVDEVAKKFRDTLFGIWCGSHCEGDKATRQFLHLARTRPHQLAFIFHFESPLTLYPSGFYRKNLSEQRGKVVGLTTVCELLRKKLGPMGDYVNVVDMDYLSHEGSQQYRWTVRDH